jgi:uncharacterized protein (DUF58 family)
LAIAAALVGALAIGLRHLDPLLLSPQVTIPARRLIEGDPIRVAVTIPHPPDQQLAVRIVEFSASLGEIVYTARPERARTVYEIEIGSPEWGRHQLGQLIVRARLPGSMTSWEQRLVDLGEVTVLPRPARLDSLLAPRASQATSGSHPTRILAGDGSEFVDIRHYAPGDRIRDINWKATARRGTPHVNRRRPERGGNVVIVLDATNDGWRRSEVGSALLQRSGQAVWGLARNHLNAQDRVGLLTQQSDGVEWLPPQGGLRARYRLLETLLGANTSGQVLRRAGIFRHDIPQSALVIGVSALTNNLTLRSLAAMRAHGRTVGVLAIDPAGILDATAELDPASLRLASMMFEAHVAYVRRLGLPIVTWRPEEDLDRAVKRLADLTRRSVRTGVLT